MCGIAAIFAYDSSVPGVDEGELVSIRDCMAARGPDGVGLWFDPARRVGLGHRRLAIIDVSPAGAQPMGLVAGSGEQRAGSKNNTPGSRLSASGFWVTFNGEIYNYRELRSELERKGCRFRSQCDTEVLLHLYATEGEAMLGKLRGMFAFAIWDGVKQTLFLARDPFGIKPLYWADDGKTFRAASQVKALLAGGRIDTSPEPAGHVGYFLWGHVPAPYTLYRGVRNLPAGHCLTVETGGKKRLRAFCSIPQVLAEAEGRTTDDGRRTTDLRLPASDLLGSSLRDTVRHHLIADVPVGVFLSSGLDSTTIAALASEFGGQLRTVTLGFEEYRGTPNDETPLAEEVAQLYGTNHQTIWVKRKDFENDLHRLLNAMDQPTNDGVNSYFISKAAAQAGLKVALSGLGGDELFGSYPSFHEIPRAVSALGRLHFPALAGRAFRVISSAALKRFTSPKYAGLLEYGGSYGGAYLLRRGMFMPWELPEILDGDLVREGCNELQTLARLDDTTRGIHSPHLKVSALEMTWYMRHQLLRDTDWASMEHSLEIRVPFVDTTLLQALGPMLAADNRPTKRDMAQTPSSPLPVSVLNRPKTGFQVPVRQWLLDSQNASSRRSVVGGHPGERGLRGWAREVYSIFADNLENHHVALRRRRNSLAQRMGEGGRRSGEGLRICVLLTDAFGGFGGIAKFNRDFLTALCSHERVAEVTALPRLMPHAPGPLPAKLNYDTAGLGGKLRYTRAALKLTHRKSEDRGQQSTVSSPSSRHPSFDLIICAHINLLPIALLLRSRLPAHCPLHLIVHGVDAWKPTRSRLANACTRWVDGFISVSNLTKRRFMRWSRLHDDQGVVLPNCVDLSAFTPGPQSDDLLDRYQLRGKKVILTFGRLASEERYKGFDEVLEIMPSLLSEMPELCYLVCGDGPDRPRLAAKARALGLAVMETGNQKSEPTSDLRPPTSGVQVLFAGYIPETEKADHYRLADVYVMPSSGEGFGIVYLEVLACGVPVIGSKADGSREALMNGKLGILVDPRDPEEIMAAVKKVLKQKSEVGSQKSEPTSDLWSLNSNGHSLDYFSATRFRQRVHDILDCITD